MTWYCMEIAAVHTPGTHQEPLRGHADQDEVISDAHLLTLWPLLGCRVNCPPTSFPFESTNHQLEETDQMWITRRVINVQLLLRIQSIFDLDELISPIRPFWCLQTNAAFTLGINMQPVSGCCTHWKNKCKRASDRNVIRSACPGPEGYCTKAR